MQVAVLRGGVVLVLLVGLSGMPPCYEVAYMHNIWIFAVRIEVNRFPLKKFTGIKKTLLAVRDCGFFLSREFIVQ